MSLQGSSQRWPAPLQVGDQVEIAAASSCLHDHDTLREGVAVLTSWGLQVSPPPPLDRRWGYLAGRDDERRKDLLLPSPGALLACARGGWGAARLLEAPIAWPEGWLLGFSDVTALLCSRWAHGLGGGIHGPLLTTLASEPQWSQERLRHLLFGQPVAPLQGTCWRSGRASGPLITVNLTVASHLLGTPHLPDLRGAILVIEDVGEVPYRIDRMLTHWRLAGVLQQLAGIGFGRFSGCDDDNKEISANKTSTDKTAADSFTLDQVLRERIADLNCPVIADLPVGHGSGGNAALPVGVQALLDADQGTLSVVMPSQR